MIDELMLLQGAQKGGSKMATYYWDSRTGTYKARRRRSRKSKGLSGLGNLGQATTLKGNLKSVQGVLVTGAIAAGGAIATNALFDKVAGQLQLDGYAKELAKAATGIALGIVISKVLKKPALGAAFAIGPVVAAAMQIFANVLGTTSGLGLVSLKRVPAPSLGQLTQISNTPGATPAWMQNPNGRLPTYTLAA